MIFLDFEGFTNKKPSLVGYRIDGSFKQIILDEDFIQISKETDIEFKEYEVFCDWIISKSDELKQPIVAWSETELDNLKDFKDDVNYCNLLKKTKGIIKRGHALFDAHQDMDAYWRGQRRTRTGRINLANKPWLKERWDLITILKLLDYPRLSNSYGKGKVTARLKTIKNGLNARGSYKQLTARQKGKWTSLKKHNEVDVDGMVYIVDKLDISLLK